MVADFLKDAWIYDQHSVGTRSPINQHSVITRRTALNRTKEGKEKKLSAFSNDQLTKKQRYVMLRLGIPTIKVCIRLSKYATNYPTMQTNTYIPNSYPTHPNISQRILQHPSQHPPSNAHLGSFFICFRSVCFPLLSFYLPSCFRFYTTRSCCPVILRAGTWV